MLATTQERITESNTTNRLTIIAKYVEDSQHEDAYVGDFHNILQSMRHLRLELSQILMQINYSSEQVSGGSEQVSNGAQAFKAKILVWNAISSIV